METILVIEDKESMAEMLRETLESEGYRVLIAEEGEKGIKFLKENRIDLVLTDLKVPIKDGIEVLKASKEENPMVPVIIMTAYGSVETAVEAMKLGAFDFITKPFDTDHLLMLIKRAIETQKLVKENLLLKEEFATKLGIPRIIGKSKSIIDVAQIVQKVAQTKTTVLLIGESGTGKELFARAIHNLSPRKEYPFVPINCAAIPRDLLESELFGHEKGSFTSADTKKLGKFELADHGTIFLDEVGDMDLTLQSKLLRAIETGEIERVGAVKSVRVDVRIVAASNRDLEKAVEEKKFREDLFYRLNVFPIQIPPLRERKEDIPLLVDFFINKYCQEIKTPIKEISKEALELLSNYYWKGNVRELENAIERAVILCEGDIISPEHFILDKYSKAFTDEKPGAISGTLEYVSKEATRKVEMQRIMDVLKQTKGNKTKAAEILQVSYKTLLTKIKEYGIES
ncbi:MAG: sigma-54-dependent Fis family transcriptional regulator [Nitrospirae bacterium]|nr:sigma-54-dependent Fis family transcriptional regulator [Nitrospirota bacterium]